MSVQARLKRKRKTDPKVENATNTMFYLRIKEALRLLAQSKPAEALPLLQPPENMSPPVILWELPRGPTRDDLGVQPPPLMSLCLYEPSDPILAVQLYDALSASKGCRDFVSTDRGSCAVHIAAQNAIILNRVLLTRMLAEPDGFYNWSWFNHWNRSPLMCGLQNVFESTPLDVAKRMLPLFDPSKTNDEALVLVEADGYTILTQLLTCDNHLAIQLFVKPLLTRWSALTVFDIQRPAPQSRYQEGVVRFDRTLCGRHPQAWKLLMATPPVSDINKALDEVADVSILVLEYCFYAWF